MTMKQLRHQDASVQPLLPLPFIVIGGYLGAGKTSLLNHLLSNAQGLRIAALVNDFGSVNIDVDLVRNRDGDTIELSNGCMCCSLSDGFSEAIDRLSRRNADFDRVVIEASGVADPGRIAHFGRSFGLALDGIFVVVDAERIRRLSRDKFVGATVRGQLAEADFIVLNKTDLITTQDHADVRVWLAQQTGDAPVFNAVQGQVPPEVIFGARETPIAVPAQPSFGFRFDHADSFGTWIVERSLPLSHGALERFATGLGPAIYRAKGFVYLRGEPGHRYLYQQVGARWSLDVYGAWSTAPLTRIVVIGRTGATTTNALEAVLDGDANAHE